jgi:hypothetical protein
MRTAGFLCIALLGVTGPALAPSLPRRAATLAAPAPLAELGATGIELDRATLATAWLGASFLDLGAGVSKQATDSPSVFESIDAAHTTADDLARVPEPTSLVLLTLGCCGLALRRPGTSLPFPDPA